MALHNIAKLFHQWTTIEDTHMHQMKTGVELKYINGDLEDHYSNLAELLLSNEPP